MASADLTRRLSPAQLFWSNALELHTDTQQMPGDHPVVDVVAGTARHNNVLIVHLLHTFAFFTVVFVPLSSFMDGMEDGRIAWRESIFFAVYRQPAFVLHHHCHLPAASTFPSSVGMML